LERWRSVGALEERWSVGGALERWRSIGVESRGVEWSVECGVEKWEGLSNGVAAMQFGRERRRCWRWDAPQCGGRPWSGETAMVRARRSVESEQGRSRRRCVTTGLAWSVLRVSCLRVSLSPCLPDLANHADELMFLLVIPRTDSTRDRDSRSPNPDLRRPPEEGGWWSSASLIRPDTTPHHTDAIPTPTPHDTGRRDG
jgi:hypothetical protein